MKNLFLALALVAYVGTASATTVISSENTIVLHDEKGKKGKKKKCSKTADGKSCAGMKASTDAKSCAKSADKKSCCASKKAEAEPMKEEVK